MSLIAPLFLIGLLAIALPVWLHRMNTLNPERHQFPSAMLLEQSKRTLIRKKLKYLLLMALRILFITLLMFAFAKPLITKPPVIAGGEGAVLHLIVIDNSFSMGHGDRFAQAKEKVSEIIANLEDEDVVQLMTASNTIDILLEPTSIDVEIQQALDGIQPGFGRLEMGNVIATLDRIISEFEQSAQIHLISDFQESALPSKFADLVPDSLKANLRAMNLHPVVSSGGVNGFIDTIVRTDNGVEVAVRTNDESLTEGTVEIILNDESIAVKTMELSDSGLSIFDFVIEEIPDGENRLQARLLNDDPLMGDNSRFIVLDNTPPRPVLLITEDNNSLAVKYLTAAVESGQQGYRVEAVMINDLDPRIIQRYPWIMVDDLGIVNETLAPVIREYLQQGGAVFAALGDRATVRDVIPVVDFNVIAERLASDLTVPYSVAAIDLSHPALAETSGWRDINVSRYLGLNVGNAADVLVTLEDGSPFIIEKKFGSGHVLLLTTSLDNVRSDLPVRPVFVNYVAEAGKYLSGDQQLRQNQIAGDYLQLIQSGSAAGQVIDPNGRDVLSLQETHRSQDIKLNLTGFYEIYTADTETLVAVNPDLRESDPSIMTIEAISAWRDALTSPGPGGGGSGPINIQQESIELWHILLLLMGVIVLLESIIGNHFLGARRGYI